MKLRDRKKQEDGENYDVLIRQILLG